MGTETAGFAALRGRIENQAGRVGRVQGNWGLRIADLRLRTG
jgi:hypothetical protein